MPESDARHYRGGARRIVGKKQRRACSKTLAIAGLTEQEMTDLIRAAGADLERISPEKPNTIANGAAQASAAPGQSIRGLPAGRPPRM